MPIEEFVKIGEKAPEFKAYNKDKKEISLSDYKNKWVILYFYPKDNTPGCTTEAIDFSIRFKDFEELNTVILGVSPDSCESHVSFATKHNLKVELLSDPNHDVINEYGVWQLKKNFGKEAYGIVRSTFIIDPKGIVQHLWENVKVKEHANEVKERLIELQKS